MTGYGVAASTLHMLAVRGRKPKDTRLLLQGFGRVGGAAALYLARAGVNVVGIVDVRSAIVDPNGLRPGDIETLLRERTGNRLPENQLTADLEVETDEFWATEGDVFVAAAASGLLDGLLQGREKAQVRAPQVGEGGVVQ